MPSLCRFILWWWLFSCSDLTFFWWWWRCVFSSNVFRIRSFSFSCWLTILSPVLLVCSLLPLLWWIWIQGQAFVQSILVNFYFVTTQQGKSRNVVVDNFDFTLLNCWGWTEICFISLLWISQSFKYFDQKVKIYNLFGYDIPSFWLAPLILITDRGRSLKKP